MIFKIENNLEEVLNFNELKNHSNNIFLQLSDTKKVATLIITDISR